MSDDPMKTDPSGYPVFDEKRFSFDREYFERLMDDDEGGCRNNIIHVTIPFCDSICAFCKANRWRYDSGIVDRYLNALKAEIRLYAQTKRAQSMSIDALYLHGGTPTVLSTAQLADLLDCCKEKFSLDGDIEITSESTTHNLGEEKAKKLAGLGVNRIYFGVQTFHDRLRGWLNRTESRADVIDKINMARRVGFDNVRIDLMYALPGESMAMWEEDLALAADLRVDNISIFKFRPHPEIRVTRMMRSGEIPPINETEREKMYDRAVEVLSGRGYVRQYTSGFALPEKRSKYFDLFYKGQCDGIGLGPTNWFYGSIGNYLHKNTDDLSTYMETLKGGNFPLTTGYSLSQEEKMRRAMIKGLSWGIDIAGFERKFGVSPYSLFGDTFKKLERDGIVNNVDGEIRMTDTAASNADMKPYLALFLPDDKPSACVGA